MFLRDEKYVDVDMGLMPNNGLRANHGVTRRKGRRGSGDEEGWVEETRGTSAEGEKKEDEGLGGADPLGPVMSTSSSS